MKKILLYSIYVLWAIILFANILRFFGNESMVAVLDSVPEMSVTAQKIAKAIMYYVEIAATLLIITRGSTPKIYIIALVATALSGFVSSPMENMYMNVLAYCIAIILYTKDHRAALEETVIVCLLYIVYGFLTQFGRFSMDWANYKNCTVQLLSCVDYKALPILGYLYSKSYGKEARLCFRGIGTLPAALCSSVTRMLHGRTSANADSSK